ncbi:MAG TPA: sigma-70 family RNA polymerase sigma factor [Solirubrobacteraceae bacterium]|nr:sigma-70 family RNA polymerase sigma factor [Solirubrobacteraceae bacterium]
MTTALAAPAPIRRIAAAPAPAATGRAVAYDDDALGALVQAARGGSDRAWERLHERLDPLVRGIARSYRLSPADVDDVAQTTWLRLLSHVDRLHEPAAVAGWLATTSRRECLRVLQVPLREWPTDDPELGDGRDIADPESELLESERRVVLERALATLPGRHRRLMTLLATEPAMDYQQLSAALRMPIGSIGPTRARSLTRLRRNPELRSVCEAGATATVARPRRAGALRG